MDLFVLELIGFFCYAVIWAFAWFRLSKGNELGSAIIITLLTTIVLHGFVSYKAIVGNDTQNFGLFNIFTITTWISMIIILWNLLRHKAHGLLLISTPIAALSLLEVAFFSGSAAIEVNQDGLDFLHILLAIGAMSILMLAAMQSLLVLYIDKGLRTHPATIHSWLGPLQSMERYLIQLLSSGFVMLTLALSLSFLLEQEANQSLHKIILTILSWCVLGLLLGGHYIKGWRGVFAAKWTLVGVFLLLLGYFGSKLVIEFIL